MKRNKQENIKQEAVASQRMQRQRKPTAKCLDLMSNAFFTYGSKKQLSTSKQTAPVESLENVETESIGVKNKHIKHNTFGKKLNKVTFNESEDISVLNGTDMPPSPESSSSVLPQIHKSCNLAVSVESCCSSDIEMITEHASATDTKSEKIRFLCGSNSPASDVLPQSITKQEYIENSPAESDQCNNIVTFDDRKPKIENEHFVSNLPDLIQDNAKDRQLDISDTFITIETKDGLSSEKMPFSQFLKKVIVEQASGSLKIDLSQLMSSFTSSAEDNGAGHRDNLSYLPSTSQMNFENKLERTKEQKSHLGEVGKFATVSDKPVKRRGRPPKQKHASLLEVKTEESGSSCNNNSVSPEFKPKGSPRGTNLRELSLKVKEKQGFSHHHPRRSARTPARSSRFGDDFVDSITLGKISSSSSSSSTWNTQLMTLALAAETHKNKPSKASNPGIIGDVDHDVQENMDDNSDFLSGKEINESKNESRTNSELTSRQDGHKKGAVDEKKKRTCSSGIRVPKTLKKYEPVDPVVKRSLNEALTLAAEATKDIGNTETCEVAENDSSTSFYYTIMEPKLDANGSGLLVHKFEQGINFRTANFSGNLSDGNQIPNSSKAYPQDRYFLCDLCENIFLSTNSWLQHNKYAHNRTIDSFEISLNKTNKSEYKCEFCDQKFPYKFMLDIHIKRKRHSEVKTFRCTLCKETFATHKSREEHWMMSHPARSCGLCGKQFTNIVMLRRHINHNCHGARFRKQTDILEVSNEVVFLSKQPDRSFEKDSFEDSDNGSIDDDLEELVQESDVENSSEDIEDDLSNSNIVKNESGKVECDHCGTEFSTYSGLWYHKLDEHHEYYPHGHREKLQEKLEKNETILQNAQDASLHKETDANKNRFFIILKPKWPPHKSNLSVSVDEKEFVFKPDDDKGMSETLPQSDNADIASKKETHFKCLQCEETFQFANSYREHRNQVHGECFEVQRLLGAFQCTRCSETYPCQFMLDRHIKHHVGKKLLPCTLCGVDFHKIQERRLHWKTEHPGIGCPNCGKMYASIKYLQKHISLNCQDHFPPTKKFLEFQKKQLSDFEMPNSVKKVEKKILQCHLCPKLCSSVHGWRRHMSEAHEDSGFSKLSNTCIICNELVYGYKALEKHLLENHAVDTGLPVEQEDGIVRDALKKCDVDITAYRKAGKDDSDIYLDEKGNYHCPSCSKTHTDIKALRTHIRIHVNMKLECSICNKVFKNPTLLKQHVQRHRKDAVYSCDSCNKKFLTLQKLNKHRKVHHSSGNFVCDLCGMSFALNDYLQKHKRCHTDKRPHSCTICGKSFRTKPELRVHVLIHTRETPFKCQFCGRGFSQKGNYRIHLAQHTGEKPYQCDQCEVSFALHCHLKRHKITHDQKIHYRCMWCDKECTQRKHMQMHVQRVHKEDFYQYEEQMKLEAPVPIAPSQVKLYNRRLGKVNKVRKQYRTRAQKCDNTIQQLVNGVVSKSEPMEEDMETSQNIVIEPLVEPMMETVTCEMPVASHESSNFEILVGEDHQNFAKHAIPVDLLGHDPSNVEIVMGENNEINIIIKDPSALQDIVGVQASIAQQLSSGHIEVQKSLQQVVEALVCHAKHACDDDSRLSLDISDLDKSALSGTSQILPFDST